jgi:DNA-binding response OmpR family regulator
MLKTSNYFNDQSNILIISDDKLHAQMLQDYILNPGVQLQSRCIIAESIDKINDLHSKSSINLVIIDIDSKFYQNTESLNKIFNDIDFKDIPKIVISQNNNLEQKILIFELGIDEFIPKPIIMPEFIAKTKNLLRKYKKFLGEKIAQAGEIKMNLINQTLELSGVNIKLSAKEFDILKLLVENPNKIFNRKEILQSVWKNPQLINERTIDVHINRLRIALSKMTNNRSYIKTVRSAGYSLDMTHVAQQDNRYSLESNKYSYQKSQSELNMIYENNYQKNIYA